MQNLYARDTAVLTDALGQVAHWPNLLVAPRAQIPVGETPVRFDRKRLGEDQAGAAERASRPRCT